MNINASIKEFCLTVAKIDDPKELEKLLTDMLTPAEIKMLGVRWRTCQMLEQQIPQREIAKKLGISISKVTRGSRVVKYGTGAIQRTIKLHSDDLTYKRQSNKSPGT